MDKGRFPGERPDGWRGEARVGEAWSGDAIADVKSGRGPLFWVLVVIGGFVAVAIFGAVFGPSEEERAAIAAQEAAEQAAAAERQKAVTRVWFENLTQQGRACDAAHTVVVAHVDAMARGQLDRYAAYDAAEVALAQCSEAWMRYGDMRAAGLPEAARDNALAAIESCKLAYFAKKQAAEKFMELFDGNMRPSLVSAIAEDGRYAQSALLRCASVGQMAVRDAGIDAEVLAEPSDGGALTE